MNSGVDIYWFGDRQAGQAVLYVHGFAVNYTSKGMFTDLADHLSDQDLASILFDLSDFDGERNATLLPLSDQQQRLREVYGTVKAEIDKVSIIAHSLGCGVAATLLPELELDKVLMLAPAGDQHGPRIKERLFKNHGAWTDEDGLMRFKRKNSTVTSFSERYVKEFDIEFSRIYESNLDRADNLKICLAESDELAPETEKIFAKYNTVCLPESDHNFTGDSRPRLLELASGFITQSQP